MSLNSFMSKNTKGKPSNFKKIENATLYRFSELKIVDGQLEIVNYESKAVKQ